MINLRCTRKLQQHLRIKPAGEERAPTSVLGDWFANLVQAESGHRFMLVTNERTLLSVVLPHDADVLVDFRERALALLRRLDLPAELIERETFHLQQIAVEKTNSRKVLGCMTDASFFVEAALCDGGRSFDDIEDKLARWLYSTTGYRYPVDLLHELLGLDPPEEPPRPSPPAIEDVPLDQGSDAAAAAARTLRKPIYQLHVGLRWISPPIWRRLRISGNISLARLHEVLQVTMGWQNCHLHEFAFPNGQRFGPPDGEFDPEISDERRAKLRKLAPEVGASFVYRYDFGDGWEHDVTVEAVLEPGPAGRTPACMDGQRACPPEDVGGVPGYERCVAALADSSDPEHREMLLWSGGFDAEAFELKALNRLLLSTFPKG